MKRRGVGVDRDWFSVSQSVSESARERVSLLSPSFSQSGRERVTYRNTDGQADESYYYTEGYFVFVNMIIQH